MSDIKIGIIGDGNTTLENAKALIEDYEQAHPDDEVSFIFGLNDPDNLGEGLTAILEWFLDDEFDYGVVILNKFDQKSADGLVSDVLEWAKPIDKAANVPATLARNTDVLFLIPKDGDDPGELTVACMAATENAEIKALDLTQGLIEMDFYSDPPVEEESTPEPEPEKPTGRRRRSSAVSEPEKVTEEPAEPEEKPARRKRRTKAEIEADKASTDDDKVSAEDAKKQAAEAKADMDERLAAARAKIEAGAEVEELSGSQPDEDKPGEYELALYAEENGFLLMTEDSLMALIQKAARELYPEIKRSPGRPKKDGAPPVSRKGSDNG